jgi:AraC family transcriptional regulator
LENDWLSRSNPQTGYHPRGGVSALDLEDDPRFLFPCSFHCLHFYLSRATLDELADEHHAKRIGTLSWPHAAVDETVSHLSLALLAGVREPCHRRQTVRGSRCPRTEYALCLRIRGMRPAARDTRLSLAPWQERRCEELMSDSLAKDLSLGDLAKECRLSVGRFVRAFKQSTGEAPYRWLLKRRVETAKEMLLFSELAIARPPFCLRRVGSLHREGWGSRLCRGAVRTPPPPPTRIGGYFSSSATSGRQSGSCTLSAN